MNKRQLLIVLVLLFAMLFALSACSGGGAGGQTEAATTVESESTEQATEGVASKMTCSHCQAEIAKDANFCSACGKAVQESATTQLAETTVAESTECVEETTAGEQNDDAKSEYRNAGFLEGVSDYVVTSDLSNVEYFNQLDYEVMEREANRYTGQLKKYYYSDKIAQGMMLRVPQFTEDSELAKTLNEEIVTLAFETVEPEYLYFFEVDYDAFIYDDVLSLSLMQDICYEGGDVVDSKILKTYHFDVSGGALKPLTSREMLARLNVSEDVLRDFAYSYIPEYFHNSMDSEGIWNNIEDDMDAAIKALDNAIENDELLLLKNAENDYYAIEIDYDFIDDMGVLLRVRFTAAEDDFKMALLSRPENAIGVIYKAREERELPNKSIYNQPIALTVLDGDSYGVPIYICAFSERAEAIDISDLEWMEVSLDSGEQQFVKKATSKGFQIVDNPDVADVYMYHAMLPEIMPFETVHMTGIDWNFSEVVTDCDIYDDMRFGSPLQYVFGTASIATFTVRFSDDQYAALTFNSDGTFTATDSGGNWAEAGVPITEGRYTIDGIYYCLFPCAEDLARGAAEVYIYQKNRYGDAITPASSIANNSFDGSWVLHNEAY